MKLSIWDLPVRIFHWLLIPLMALAWWTENEGYLDWHRLSGYVLLGLIVFRIIWGFIGSETARFSHFLRGPTAIAAYFGKKNGEPRFGHNPIGGWSVLAMLVLIAALIVKSLPVVWVRWLVVLVVLYASTMMFSCCAPSSNARRYSKGLNWT